KQAQNRQSQICCQKPNQEEGGPCSQCKTGLLGTQQNVFTEPTERNGFFTEKLKATVSEIVESRNRLQEENLKLQQEVKTYQRKCQNFEARLTEVKNELQSRDDLLNVAELECQQLQKEVAKMEDYKNKEDNHVKLQSAYAQCIKELETKKVEMHVLEQQCENQQKALNQIRDRLYQEAQSHRSEVERMRNEISDLTEELHQKEITIATITEKAALLERQLQMKLEIKEKTLGKQQENLDLLPATVKPFLSLSRFGRREKLTLTPVPIKPMIDFYEKDAADSDPVQTLVHEDGSLHDELIQLPENTRASFQVESGLKQPEELVSMRETVHGEKSFFKKRPSSTVATVHIKGSIATLLGQNNTLEFLDDQTWVEDEDL
ncbi:UNVERIFIED_CONTAM: hypothetical protein K2H54_068254, partial [Gekko kuhli]